MQYSKVPPKSPESSFSNEEQPQDAIVVFSKGVVRQRKLSRNKQSASASAIGADGKEETAVAAAAINAND